jgi:Bacterial Ig-like domain
MPRYWPLTIVLLMAACAQVREPTGGEKDEQGPLLVESTPFPMTTGFAGDRIVLRFNERVQLKSIRENLVVSPPLSKAPTVRLIGDRSVQIGFEEPLLANTTYAFDFAKGVVDLTESNVYEGGPFVLSTGSVIDSARLSVDVNDARTLAPMKGVEVLLFAEGDTCDPRNCQPHYFARTDEQGHAHIEFMRPDNYKAFALRDLNGNHLYDLPTEAVAFGSEGVTASTDSLVTPAELRMFTALDSAQRLLDARFADGALRLAFSRPVSDVGISSVAGGPMTGAWLPEWNAARDSVRVWYLGDSMVQAPVLVRADDLLLDTVDVEQRSPAADLILARVAITGTPAVELEASRPVAVVDTTRFTLKRDSVVLPFRLSVSEGQARRFLLNTGLKPGEKGTLNLLPGSLVDHQGRTNDTLSIPIDLPATNESGSLSVSLPALGDGYQGAFILELLDAKGQVVLLQAGPALPAQISWKTLPPQAFGLRLVADDNTNGRWDAGSLQQGQQPEGVYVHPKGATVRAGWEVEVVWE